LVAFRLSSYYYPSLVWWLSACRFIIIRVWFGGFLPAGWVAFCLQVGWLFACRLGGFLPAGWVAFRLSSYYYPSLVWWLSTCEFSGVKVVNLGIRDQITGAICHSF
jgi:hypothetical protein